MRTDLVTLAFPGIDRPSLNRSEASFFVFLDVLLQSPRRGATQAAAPVPVRTVRLWTPGDARVVEDVRMMLGTGRGVKARRPRPPRVRPRLGRTLLGPLFPMAGSGATLRARPDGGGIFGGSRPLIDDREPGGHLAPSDGRTRSIVVLLPALNEAMAVGSVIERIPMEALRGAGYEVYVWVVDGRSVDATPEVAKERGASIYVQRGAGKGNGVRQALDHLMNDRSRQNIAAPRVYVMLDADTLSGRCSDRPPHGWELYEEGSEGGARRRPGGAGSGGKGGGGGGP